MDRLVARAPEELVGALIAERGDGGQVGEADEAVGVHDPDGLGRGLQHGGQEVLGTDLPAAQVRQRSGHGEPSLRSPKGRAGTVSKGAPSTEEAPADAGPSAALREGSSLISPRARRFRQRLALLAAALERPAAARGYSDAASRCRQWGFSDDCASREVVRHETEIDTNLCYLRDTCYNWCMPRDEEITFADHMGRFYARRYAFPPMVGRVLGYLLVCEPRDQTIAELSEALLASRSAITGALNVLERLHAIRARERPGSGWTASGPTSPRRKRGGLTSRSTRSSAIWPGRAWRC